MSWQTVSDLVCPSGRGHQEKQSSALSPPPSPLGGAKIKQKPQKRKIRSEFGKQSQATGLIHSVSSPPRLRAAPGLWRQDHRSTCSHFRGWGGAHLLLRNQELRASEHESLSLLQGGTLADRVMGRSESSKGLQRAGVSSHFLAREGIALSPLTGPDRGVRRCLYLQKTGSACNHPPHHPVRHVASSPQCVLGTGGLESDPPETSTCCGQEPCFLLPMHAQCKETLAERKTRSRVQGGGWPDWPQSSPSAL